MAGEVRDDTRNRAAQPPVGASERRKLEMLLNPSGTEREMAAIEEEFFAGEERPPAPPPNESPVKNVQGTDK